MDLNPFLPVGIDEDTVRLLDVFLLHCLLSDSPLDTPQEIAALARNQQAVAARGREPGLRLERGPTQVLLMDWALEVLQACLPIAAALDAQHGNEAHSLALQSAVDALHQPATLPSARVVAAMQQDPDGGHLRFGQTRSAQIRDTLMALDLPEPVLARLAQEAQDALQAQADMEAADTVSFEEFRRDYVSAQHLTL